LGLNFSGILSGAKASKIKVFVWFTSERETFGLSGAKDRNKEYHVMELKGRELEA